MYPCSKDAHLVGVCALSGHVDMSELINLLPSILKIYECLSAKFFFLYGGLHVTVTNQFIYM